MALKQPRSGPSTRARDAARVLPVIGAVLFMPPLITLFVGDAAVLGVPPIVVYLFGTWLALIVCAALLAPRLRPSGEVKREPESD
jgi:hypothetical protein